MLGFMNNMEKAQIAMEYFLGNAKDASAFIYNMKDFAAETAFSTEQALMLSRKLMAAQFEASKVRSMMEILNDASSATGGTAEQMDRIVLALTQMRTNGKIAGQELRQFAEAGIPIYQILREELGLTSEELMKIGDLKISGDLGVQAVLSGLERRYKGAALRIANTVPGMWETIKDDMLIIGESMFRYPYKVMEEGLRGLRDGLEKARALIFEGGFGQLFEHMFDKGTQQDLRIIAGSFNSLAGSIKILVTAVLPIAVAGFNGLARGMAILLPILAALVRTFAVAVQWIMQTVPAIKYLISAIGAMMIATVVTKVMLMLWRVTGLGMICTAVASAVMTLVGALRILFVAMLTNPIILILVLIAGALGYFALQTKWAQNAMDSFTKSMHKMAGFNPNKIFQPVKKTTTDDMGQFNEEAVDASENLQEMTDKSKKAGEAAKKAAKKIKDSFTASFDELYQIPDKLDDVGSGLDDIDGIDEMPLVSMPDIGMPGIPEMPSMGGALPGLTIPEFKMPKIDWSGIWQSIKDFGAKVKKYFAEDFIDDIKFGWKFSIDWIKVNAPKLWEWTKDSAKAIWDWAKETGLALHNWLMQFELYRETFNSLKKFWDKWGGEIIDFFKNTWELIKEVFKLALAAIWWFIEGTFQPFIDFWEEWGDEVVGFFKNTWTLIKEVFGAAWSVISFVLMTNAKGTIQALKDLWPILVGIFKNLWENVKTIFIAALDIILDTVGTAFSILNSIVEIALAILQGDWKKVWEELVSIVVVTWEWLVQTLTTLMQFAIDMFKPWADDIFKILNDLWVAITDDLNRAWDAFTGALAGWWEGLLEDLNVFTTNIQTNFSNLWTWITESATTAWNGIIDFFNTVLGTILSGFLNFGVVVIETFRVLWEGLVVGLSTAWGHIVIFLETTLAQIGVMWETFSTATLDILAQLWEGLQLGLSTAWTQMTQVLSDILDVIVQRWNAFVETATTLFSELWTAIRTGAGTAWKMFTTAITGWFNGIMSVFRTFRNNLVTNFTNLWNAIRSGASTAWSTLVGIFNRIVGSITGAFTGMRNVVVGIFDSMWGGIRATINTIIRGINGFTGFLGDMSIDVPKMELPGGGSIGGGTIGMPRMPKIPMLAKGGVIDKHMLIQAGEKNSREVMIPLENSTAMKPFSAAVANDLAAMIGAGGQQQQSQSSQPTMYVHTLIADERGLRELERKMHVIRQSEGMRGAQK
jgi:tape measure domain-containing protein